MSTTIAYRAEHGSLVLRKQESESDTYCFSYQAAFSYFGSDPSKLDAETEFILSQVKLRQNPEVQRES